MSDLYDDTDEDKILVVDEDLALVEEPLIEISHRANFDARRRLEDLMDEKRLQNELEDFLDDIDE